MRIILVSIIFFIQINFLYCQAESDTVKHTHSNLKIAETDTGNVKIKAINDGKELNRKVLIKTSPEEASVASVTIIKTSRIHYGEFFKTTDKIEPDTLGTWITPNNISLLSGDYEFVADKKGFREELVNIQVGKAEEYNINIEMTSLAEVQHIRNQWNTAKWISAAVAIGAGLASYYFNNKINSYYNEYNSATSSDVIQDKRNSIDRMRKYYRISSGLTFAALGGFGISWIIEISY